jgi:hypothetical protein
MFLVCGFLIAALLYNDMLYNKHIGMGLSTAIILFAWVAMALVLNRYFPPEVDNNSDISGLT